MKKVQPETLFDATTDDRLIEQTIRTLLEDSYIASIVRQLAMTDEDIHVQLATLLHMQQDHEEVAQCIRQKACIKPHGHYQVTLTRNEGGYLQRQLTPCPMLEDVYKIQRYLVYDDFPEIWKDDHLFDDIGKRSYRLPLLKVLQETFLKFKSSPKNTFIYGPPRTGKSFSVATFAYKFALNERGTIGVIQAPTLSQRLLDVHQSDTTVFQREWDTLSRLDVLIIDRLGDETALEKTRDVLWIPLLQTRLNAQKVTLIVSSFSLDDLGVLYAPFPSQKPKAKQLAQLIESFEHHVYVPVATPL
jgi:DNA replication protein DnaC